MKNFPIYLDYSSTTPVDKRVFNKILGYLKYDGVFGNPSSRSHVFGWLAKNEIKLARNKIANFIGSKYNEIFFTSGTTESNNLAIKGVTSFYYKKGKNIITSEMEHKSILNTCNYLEKFGYNISYIYFKKNGSIDLNKFKLNINKKTILVSLMHVNNEVGLIQDIRKIGYICNKNNIFFHVDAAQSIGKLSINVKKLKVNLLSLSSHKIYGPKGIGALFISNCPRVHIETQIHGGDQENYLRAGTLPIHQIIGFSEACFIMQKKMLFEQIKISKLIDFFMKNINNIEKINLNSNKIFSIPNIINISFYYIEGESLIISLKKLALSSGSSCTNSNLEPSYVLKLLYVSNELINSSIRFSIGRYTSKNEICYVVFLLNKSVSFLRSISPLWEMYKEGINLKKVKWNY